MRDSAALDLDVGRRRGCMERKPAKMTEALRRQLAEADGERVPVVVFLKPTQPGMRAPGPEEFEPLAAEVLERVGSLTRERPEHVEVHSLLGTLAIEATGAFVEKLAEQPEVDRLIDDVAMDAL